MPSNNLEFFVQIKIIVFGVLGTYAGIQLDLTPLTFVGITLRPSKYRDHSLDIIFIKIFIIKNNLILAGKMEPYFNEWDSYRFCGIPFCKADYTGLFK